MDLPEYIEALSRSVDDGWSAVGHSRAMFPSVASSALERIGAPGFDAAELLAAAVRGGLPEQVNYTSRFGQPPLTLHRGDDYYIEALYWFDSTTAIHEHAFAGAFRVLAGGSIHVRYGFDTRRAWSERLEAGELRATESEVLRRGDVRPIEWRRAGIHSLFHLEQPSVTLVVRTIALEGSRQLRFTRAGLAFDPFFNDSMLGRRMQALVALHRVDPARAFDEAQRLVTALDHMRGLVLLRRWFEFDGSVRHADLVDVYEQRLGVDGVVHAFFADVAAEQDLVLRRTLLTEPRHRLYLALLLNVDAHDERLRLAAQLFPEADPGETLADIVGELAGRELRGISGMVLSPSALDALQTSLRAGEPVDLTGTLSSKRHAHALVDALRGRGEGATSSPGNSTEREHDRVHT